MSCSILSQWKEILMGQPRPRSKEARELERAVLKAGGSVERTAGGHLKVVGPSGIAIVASTFGKHTMREAVRTIRNKAGLAIEV